MQIKFKILEHISTISQSDNSEYTLELNKISWNDREPKLDLRRWRITDGERIPQKGLTFNSEELKTLKNVLNENCQ